MHTYIHTYIHKDQSRANTRSLRKLLWQATSHFFRCRLARSLQLLSQADPPDLLPHERQHQLQHPSPLPPLFRPRHRRRPSHRCRPSRCAATCSSYARTSRTTRTSTRRRRSLSCSTRSAHSRSSSASSSTARSACRSARPVRAPLCSRSLLRVHSSPCSVFTAHCSCSFSNGELLALEPGMCPVQLCMPCLLCPPLTLSMPMPMLLTRENGAGVRVGVGAGGAECTVDLAALELLLSHYWIVSCSNQEAIRC